MASILFHGGAAGGQSSVLEALSARLLRIDARDALGNWGPAVAAVGLPSISLYLACRSARRLLEDVPAPPRGRVETGRLNWGASENMDIEECVTRVNVDATNKETFRKPDRKGAWDQVSSTRGAFPPPYPNGWYLLCESKDLPTPTDAGAGEEVDTHESVRAFSICGEEIVAFRNVDGQVGCLHAFCSHQGVHLGCGGEVDGVGLRCPYHRWKFSPEGKLLHIPQIQKKVKMRDGETEMVDYDDNEQPDCNRERNHLRSFPTCEEFGLIWVWIHADEESPGEHDEGEDEERTRLPSSAGGSSASSSASRDDGDRGGRLPPLRDSLLQAVARHGMGCCGSLHVPTLAMHVMEPSHNTVDWYHFSTVHRRMGVHWLQRLSPIIAEFFVSPPRAQIYKGTVDDDGLPFRDYRTLIWETGLKQLTLEVNLPSLSSLGSIIARLLAGLVSDACQMVRSLANGSILDFLTSLLQSRCAALAVPLCLSTSLLCALNIIRADGKISWVPSFCRRGATPCFLPALNQARFFGPQNFVTQIHIPGFGRWIMLLCMIPTGPFRTECGIWGFAEDAGRNFDARGIEVKGEEEKLWPPRNSWRGRAVRHLLCRLIMLALKTTLLQERVIWETKVMHSQRNAVKGDWSWRDYDRWMQQFYSKSSIGYEDLGKL